ncbi:hypothetical protein V8D89_006391 [Ganoderma adspersum]
MSSGCEQAAGQPRAPSNDGQLISNLPPELFVQVLENVYWMLRRPGVNRDANWTVPYQLVCRRWRDVICSTPQFWQKIDVSSSSQWLDFCLARCAGIPASVEVWDPTSAKAIFGTLCPHASSIGAFRLFCNVPYLRDLSGLPQLLATPMLALETLSLTGPHWKGEILDVALMHDLVPRLTSFELWHCTAPRDVAVYTSLRSLTFLRTTWSISYNELLEVLGKCCVLEHLCLGDEIMDPFASDLADIPTGTDRRRTTPLVLPRLKSMVLHGRRESLFHFLAAVHVPQATTVELKNCVNGDGSGPLPTCLLARDPQRRIPFLSAPRAISLSCWDGSPFQLSLRGGPDGNALFSVDYGMVHNVYWPGNEHLEPNLVVIMDTFSVASVETLEVEGCLDEVAVETWQRMFEAFSSLRTLRIKGCGALDSLWLGLSCATASSLEHGGAVCCPSLSEISIDDRLWIASRFKFTATTGLFEVVREVLGGRATAGDTRLRKFQLYLKYTDELWRRTSELREAFVEDMKALVEELDYREWQT